jgi:hypothetical protein
MFLHLVTIIHFAVLDHMYINIGYCILKHVPYNLEVQSNVKKDNLLYITDIFRKAAGNDENTGGNRIENTGGDIHLVTMNNLKTKILLLLTEPA